MDTVGIVAGLLALGVVSALVGFLLAQKTGRQSDTAGHLGAQASRDPAVFVTRKDLDLALQDFELRMDDWHEMMSRLYDRTRQRIARSAKQDAQGEVLEGGVSPQLPPGSEVDRATRKDAVRRRVLGALHLSSPSRRHQDTGTDSGA